MNLWKFGHWLKIPKLKVVKICNPPNVLHSNTWLLIETETSFFKDGFSMANICFILSTRVVCFTFIQYSYDYIVFSVVWYPQYFRYLLILFRDAPVEVWAMTKNPIMVGWLMQLKPHPLKSLFFLSFLLTFAGIWRDEVSGLSISNPVCY